MADELSEQIKVVEAKIAKVEGRIETVTEQLERIVARLEGPELSGEQRAELVEREKRLGGEVHDLREKEKQLREKENLLMVKQQQGAGCRSWPRCSAHVLW